MHFYQRRKNPTFNVYNGGYILLKQIRLSIKVLVPLTTNLRGNLTLKNYVENLANPHIRTVAYSKSPLPRT